MDDLSPQAVAPTILCVNVGSSTLKGALYRRIDGAEPVELATAEVPSGSQALAELLESLPLDETNRLDIVAHRLVHGGPRLTDHTVLDSQVRESLEAAVVFAPLHLPGELAVIDAITQRYPQVSQVVCFDTAFHRSLPEVARRLALPTWVHDEGIQRYGFHGLSYEYVVSQLGAEELGRAVIAHLGSGASLAAIVDGRCVDTTMGLTPTGGVVMATRSGDLDPGVILHLIRQHHLDGDALEQLLDHQSGLLGISGSSGDMRELLARHATDPAAALAIEAFCHSVRKAIGALTAVLGGLDTIVFTAGIGEHAPDIRRRICDRLEHLGVRIDPERNQRDEPLIGLPDADVAIRVVRTDENLAMARHATRLCR